MWLSSTFFALYVKAIQFFSIQVMWRPSLTNICDDEDNDGIDDDNVWNVVKSMIGLSRMYIDGMLFYVVNFLCKTM